VLLNGVNAAGGLGITEKIYKQFLNWGVHVVKMGNHTWDKREICDFIVDAKQLISRDNFLEVSLGKGLTRYNLNGIEIAIINLQVRTFLPPLDDPFRKADALIAEAKKRTNLIFIDFQAEATSEMQALGWYVDGRASAVVGTHTHVQTADERVLPEGTAYITDVGMIGP